MHKTDWFFNSKYGVMMHFLPQPWEETERQYPFFRKVGLMSPAEWNRLVDRFDVQVVVDQLREIQVGYLLISFGQTSGYYCSPNPVYDRLCGFRAGERCSKRDLPLDLYRILDEHGIKLMDLPAELNRECATPAQLMGEYYWVTYTRELSKLDMPDERLLKQWVKWSRA